MFDELLDPAAKVGTQPVHDIGAGVVALFGADLRERSAVNTSAGSHFFERDLAPGLERQIGNALLEPEADHTRGPSMKSKYMQIL